MVCGWVYKKLLFKQIYDIVKYKKLQTRLKWTNTNILFDFCSKFIIYNW